MYKHILSELHNSSQIITINREDKMNALTIDLIQEIGEEVERCEADAKVRTIIITGKGVKAFAAGADISEFAGFNAVQAKKMSANGHRVFDSIEQCSKPVIAAVNGFALGGGCELAMSCHVRISSENAKYGQPEVNLGVPPGYGGTQRLAQIVGKGRALDMLISAKAIDANTALNYGLTTLVVPIDTLMEECLSYANKLISKSPLAISEVIKCTNALYSIEDGFKFEIDSFANSFETNDFKEGTTAFVEKRKPEF